MSTKTESSSSKGRSKLPFIIVGVAAVIIAAIALAALVLGNQGGAGESGSQSQQIQQMAQDAAAPEEPARASGVEHILLIGDDKWVDDIPGRSDLIVLLRVDFDEVSSRRFPSRHRAHDRGRIACKLNSVYESSGPEALQRCPSSRGRGRSVRRGGFDGFQSIVSYFGGIEVDVPYSVTYSFYTHDYPDETFQAGEQVLDAWRAMALSRSRTGYSQYGLNEDMMRQVVDRQMLTTLTGYVLTEADDPAATAEQLLAFVSTNIPSETVVLWVETLASLDELTVYGTSGPVDGGIDAASGLWLTPQYPEKWAALMDAVEAGEDPSTVDVQLDSTAQSDHARSTRPLCLRASPALCFEAMASLFPEREIAAGARRLPCPPS